MNDAAAPDRGHLFVGYLISPPGRDKRKLEDLFLPQVDRHDFGECARSFAGCATAKGSDQAYEKLLLRSYVACFNAYNTNVQSGLQRGALNLEDAAFAEIRGFLSEADRIRSSL
jgi:hypothetical protein